MYTLLKINTFPNESILFASKHFSSITDIYQRIQSKLSKRSQDEIEAAEELADFFIDEYFENEKNQHIELLATSGGWELDFLDGDKHSVSEIADLINNWHNMRPPLKFAHKDNMSKVHALKECIGSWEDLNYEECPNIRPYELFAAISLQLISKAIHSLNNFHVKQSISISTISTVSDELIAAMDAICSAEQLFLNEIWENTSKEKIDNHNSEVKQIQMKEKEKLQKKWQNSKF